MKLTKQLHGRPLGLTLLFVLVACAQPTPSPTQAPVTAAATYTVAPPTVIAATPTPSATRLPQQTVTATPWPSATPPIWPPTLTPATPSVSLYRLRPTSPELSDHVIAQFHGWLNAIRDDATYHGYYGYLDYVGQYAKALFPDTEALLRYPSANQATRWRWQRAHDLTYALYPADVSDTPQLMAYADLMAEALNAGQVTPDSLSAWFAYNENRITLSVATLPVPAGYESSYIATAEYVATSPTAFTAQWWIVGRDGQYEVYGLNRNRDFHRIAGSSATPLVERQSK